MKTPRNYQLEFVERFKSTRGLVLADDCGLGKTLTSVLTAESENQWPVLIVCPKRVVSQWVETIAIQTPDRRVLVTDWIPWDFHKLGNSFDYAIITWDELSSSKTTTIYEVVWPLVIADEAHRAKKHSTKRSKGLRSIPRLRSLAVTATPYEKQEEIWALLNFIAPESFTSYWGFIAKYFEKGMNWAGYPQPTLKKPQVFYGLLSEYLVKRTKQEVLPELPPKIETEIFVEMSEQQQEAYQLMSKATDVMVAVGEVHLLILNVLSLIQKLQMLCACPKALGFNFDSTKIEWVKEFVEDHPDQVVVFFTRHLETAYQLGELLHCEVIAEGNTDCSLFKSGKAKHIVGTIDSMGEGLDFPFADACVFVETHWSSIKMTQAVDRIHRMNITTPKNIYYLVSSRNDKRILHCSQDKMSEREFCFEYIKLAREEGL